jgi:hypothetical protein
MSFLLFKSALGIKSADDKSPLNLLDKFAQVNEDWNRLRCPMSARH